jgi:hypothetical protein
VLGVEGDRAVVPDRRLPPKLEIVKDNLRVSAMLVRPKSKEFDCTFKRGGVTETPVKVTIVRLELLADLSDKKPLNVPNVRGEKFREMRMEVPGGIKRGCRGAPVKLKAGLSSVSAVIVKGPNPTF